MHIINTYIHACIYTCIYTTLLRTKVSIYYYIYMYIYDDIFYNIYTTFTIISLTFGRQRGYHTNTGRLQIPTRAPRQYFGSRVFFFLWRLITFRIERVTDLFGYTPGGSACRKSWLTIPGHGDIVRRKYTVILN